MIRLLRVILPCCLIYTAFVVTNTQSDLGRSPAFTKESEYAVLGSFKVPPAMRIRVVSELLLDLDLDYDPPELVYVIIENRSFCYKKTRERGAKYQFYGMISNESPGKFCTGRNKVANDSYIVGGDGSVRLMVWKGNKSRAALGGDELRAVLMGDVY